MFDPIEWGRDFCERLMEVDATITARVAAGACSRCGGPLHVGNYLRKPRGGLIAMAGEEFALRFSLCCGREGCRRRTTPPSVRFLGRRVYLGAVVVLASAIAIAVLTGSAEHHATGVPPRTLRRWARWWRDSFPATAVFASLSARLVPAVQGKRLPASLLERIPGTTAVRVRWLLDWLAPLTTASTPDGARFVRGLV
jgi:hypothetical protein